MSNAIYPSLPGLEFPVQKEAIWEVGKLVSASGRRFHATYWSYPAWRWTLSYEFLREGGGFTEFQTLMAFFNARGGPADDFLFSDPDDNTATNAQIGTGNGSLTDFRLSRSMGGYIEPVGQGTPTQVTVAGSATTAYTLVNNGTTIRFNVAPANGAVIRWTGTYLWRVFFDGDTQAAEEFAANFWRTRQVSLISQKG